jgi:predicted enzyme related to lactoylglutathione lyase
MTGADLVTNDGTFIWNELDTPDQEASGAFFSALLGWTCRALDAGPFGTYTIFQQNGQDVAGMMNPTNALGAREPRWQAYIAVDDVDACAVRVPALGGRVVVPPHDVPEFGRVCQISDPTGALVCLVTTRPR